MSYTTNFNRSSHFVKVTANDVVEVEVHALSQRGEHQTWITKQHIQELDLLLLEVIKFHVAAELEMRYKARGRRKCGEKKQMNKKTAENFTQPQILTGESLRMAYTFRKRNLPQRHMILHNKASGYVNMHLFDEKLVVYVYHLDGYNKYQGKKVTSTVRSDDKISPGISSYFGDSKASDSQRLGILKKIVKKNEGKKLTRNKRQKRQDQKTEEMEKSTFFKVKGNDLGNDPADNLLLDIDVTSESDTNNDTRYRRRSKRKLFQMNEPKISSCVQGEGHFSSAILPHLACEISSDHVRDPLTEKVEVHDPVIFKRPSVLPRSAPGISVKLKINNTGSLLTDCDGYKLSKVLSSAEEQEQNYPETDCNESQNLTAFSDVDESKLSKLLGRSACSQMNLKRKKKKVKVLDCAWDNFDDLNDTIDPCLDNGQQAMLEDNIFSVTCVPPMSTRPNPKQISVDDKSEESLCTLPHASTMCTLPHASTMCTLPHASAITDPAPTLSCSAPVEQPKNKFKFKRLKLRQAVLPHLDEPINSHSEIDDEMPGTSGRSYKASYNSSNSDELRVGPQLDQIEAPLSPELPSLSRYLRYSMGSGNENTTVTDVDVKHMFSDCFVEEELSDPVVIKIEDTVAEDIMTEIKQTKKVSELTAEHLEYLVTSNETYLRNIFQGKVENSRHQTYKAGIRQRANLVWQIPLKMFKDSQIEVVLQSLQRMFCKRHIKYLDYVLKVMFPEILIKIYMDMFGVDWDEAEDNMNNASLTSETNSDSSSV